jgi:hypothetical protein
VLDRCRAQRAGATGRSRWPDCRSAPLIGRAEPDAFGRFFMGAPLGLGSSRVFPVSRELAARAGRKVASRRKAGCHTGPWVRMNP